MSLKHKIIGLAALVGLGGTMEAEAQNTQKNTPTKAEIEAVKKDVKFVAPHTYDATKDFQKNGETVNENLQAKEIIMSQGSSWIQKSVNMSVTDITKYKFTNGDVAIVETGFIGDSKAQGVCQITYKSGKEELKVNYADVCNCINNGSNLNVTSNILDNVHSNLKLASQSELRENTYLRRVHIGMTKVMVGANKHKENMKNNQFIPEITRQGFSDAQLMAYGITTPGKQTKPDNLQLVNQSTIVR